ncbi:hypothetical protein MSG28_016213 [Choristoneura fumiferana]|uniref:Uncharacterized protein n=1 Tax=Choristoneura fumiferana TaxID=7141 RepID=A0ACC0K5S3_CHOFU|nr:hypothetical protein MSG28_016213 [Choristoneura fumiferana]
MGNNYLYILLIGSLLHSQALAVWQCTTDDECSSLSGSSCSGGECVCPATQQVVGGGTMCADFAPYLTSSCVDDFQCSRLFTAFHCRRNDEQTGNCFCQPGNHYFLGRCWPSIPLGEACTRDEECMGPIRDPYAMTCDGTCQCAEGYYGRQRGECRRIGAAIGDRCVLDEDCQFANGVCDPLAFTCYDSTNPSAHIQPLGVNASATHKMAAAVALQDGVACSAANSCSAPFQCSSVGICVCPLGYYGSPDGSSCYAVARRITDFCFSDEQCHSFGAASFCGAPGDWGLRTCECDLEQAVWDAQRSMCRLFAAWLRSQYSFLIRAEEFGRREQDQVVPVPVARIATTILLANPAVKQQCLHFCVSAWRVRQPVKLLALEVSYLRPLGIGEACQVDSDCMAGELEIQCQLDGEGEGFCACPDGLEAVDGLCLTSGLEVGEECQITQECTGTANTECLGGLCTCGNGYQQVDDYCAPSLGGTCTANTDCIINNTVCASGATGLTCQCQESYVEYDAECWENSKGYNANCTIDAQCVAALGSSGACLNGVCLCGVNFHYRDGACWPMTELGSPSTEEQCVGILAEVQNGICTCPSNFFFDEGMRDCTKVARRITDFCFSDEQCHSFGAASFCGAPGDWGLRTCECDLEQAVWDAQRSMCRLFAGIGEACQVDSDCMAGELEIQCQLDGEGEGFCACPDGLEAVDGLCLTSGLEVGEECQITQECTGTANTECLGGLCTCGNGYQQVDDYCAPSLGGTCTANTDCIINSTVCVSGATGLTCQCQESHVEYDAECWENSKGYNANCTIDAQCVAALGSSGACLNGVCLCGVNFHYRDGACWPMTGLFEKCSRSSQCFLGELTDIVVCRNSICQCDFNFPYSEELGTCKTILGKPPECHYHIIVLSPNLYKYAKFQVNPTAGSE